MGHVIRTSIKKIQIWGDYWELNPDRELHKLACYRYTIATILSTAHLYQIIRGKSRRMEGCGLGHGSRRGAARLRPRLPRSGSLRSQQSFGPAFKSSPAHTRKPS